jgi:hypothetical protein
MNERIRRLMEQAGFLNKDEESIGYFAELIIRECMSICEDLGDKGLDGHYCVDKIRKEFGV